MKRQLCLVIVCHRAHRCMHDRAINHCWGSKHALHCMEPGRLTSSKACPATSHTSADTAVCKEKASTAYGHAAFLLQLNTDDRRATHAFEHVSLQLLKSFFVSRPCTSRQELCKLRHIGLQRKKNCHILTWSVMDGPGMQAQEASEMGGKSI